MCKRIYITFCFAFFTHFAIGQILLPNMPVEVVQIMQQQQDAWNNGNIPRFMDGYWKSDSLMFIGSRGLSYGYKKTLDNYLKSYPTKAKMGHLEFTNESWVQLSPSCGLLIGKWSLNESTRGMYSLIWRKHDGKWVIVADHSS